MGGGGLLLLPPVAAPAHDFPVPDDNAAAKDTINPLLGARPDPELLTLKAELLEAQGDLAQAYRQFDQALDPELVESCVYQISAVKARCNYLIRAIKERSPEAAAAAGLEGASTWT